MTLLLGACNSAPASSDSGPLDAGASDVGADVGLPDTGPACDVSPAPDMLPMLVGELTPLVADAGSPIPAQTGGDPTGVWRIDHATFYTAPSTAGMFDPMRSSITGTGWIVVSATELRLELSLEVTIAGTIAGTIHRHQVTDIRGAYATSGNTLDVTVQCVSPPSSMMMSGMFQPQFTSSGATGTLVLVTNGMMGMTTILLHGARSAT